LNHANHFHPFRINPNPETAIDQVGLEMGVFAAAGWTVEMTDISRYPACPPA